VVDGALGLLEGFTFRDVERAPPGPAAHYALADLFAHESVAPVTQGGAHGVVAFGGGVDQVEYPFVFHRRLLPGLGPPLRGDRPGFAEHAAEHLHAALVECAVFFDDLEVVRYAEIL